MRRRYHKVLRRRNVRKHGKREVGENFHPSCPKYGESSKNLLSPAGTIHGSKKAVTYYQVLKSYANASLVQLHLETGRTHRIRVHMAGTGHPLLGDTLYNESQTGKASVPGNPFTRAALHAWKLKFYHPFTGNKILLEAPFPLDFENFVKKMKHRRCAVAFCHFTNKNALQGHLKTQQQERKC